MKRTFEELVEKKPGELDHIEADLREQLYQKTRKHWQQIATILWLQNELEKPIND